MNLVIQYYHIILHVDLPQDKNNNNILPLDPDPTSNQIQACLCTLYDWEIEEKRDIGRQEQTKRQDM